MYIFEKIKKYFVIARIYLTSENQWFVTAFWRHFYKRHKRTHNNTYWMGIHAIKPPGDLWVYQEIIYEKKPDVIIECGTKNGGTSLYMANICDIVGTGRVISIDIKERDVPKHPRITYLIGDTASEESLKKAKTLIKQGDRVMVILDSDHSFEHVNRELAAYASLVTPGQYLIVEDSVVNGNPVFEDFGPGPMESIEKFLPEHPEFTSDRSREKFWVTYSPKGFLLRN
jgi:cephalosporin hydroxylase